MKYPRTYHFPSSPGKTDDDKVLKNLDAFLGKRVIASIKMDGENTTIENGQCHARSLDSKAHPSRSWVRSFASTIELAEGQRVCGENLFARHSIWYAGLPTYFMGFGFWEGEKCLSWDETIEWFALLGIEYVPVLYDGIFDLGTIHEIFADNYSEHEGYVVRIADSFSAKEFATYCGKHVRSGHISTTNHWMYEPIVKNYLRLSSSEVVSIL